MYLIFLTQLKDVVSKVPTSREEETKGSFWHPYKQPNMVAAGFTPTSKLQALREVELQHQCPPQGGSSGKGTTLNYSSDVDLVLFLSCFSSFQDQAAHRRSIISFIKKRLIQHSKNLAYSITIVPQKETTRVPRSLSFQVQARKTSEVIGVDVLPAYDALGKDNDGLRPGKLVRDPSLIWPWGGLEK